MRRALVTGATSFIGLNLLDRLGALGTELHAIVRSTSDLSRFRHLQTKPHIHVIDDGMETVSSAVACAKPDMVFHLAARYLREHQPEHVTDLINTNVRLGTYILEAMVKHGVKHF